MRCISCNRKLLDFELLASKSDGSPEDLCTVCKPYTKQEYLFTEDHEYQFENLEEGVAKAKYLRE